MANDDTNPQSFGKKLQNWLQAHGAVVALVGVLTGVAVGVGIPVWENYWIERPELSVEINAINRTISPDAGFPAEDELLAVILRRERRLIRDVRYVEELTSDGFVVRRAVGRKNEGMSPDLVQAALERAKQELKDLPERIDARKQDKARVDSLTVDTITFADIVRLNRPLSPVIEVDAANFSSRSENRDTHNRYFGKIVSDLRAAYSKRLEELETRYTELQTQLPSIERRIESLNEELLQKRSFFTISAVLNNSGRASTSIKQPALLRIYIGTGNYVDLKLLLQDYRETAEAKAHGTQIVSFQSDEISTLPESDQAIINTYWGQSVHTILFVEDILGNIHSSNRIAFSEGLYQKIIYDRLASEASKTGYF